MCHSDDCPCIQSLVLLCGFCRLPACSYCVVPSHSLSVRLSIRFVIFALITWHFSSTTKLQVLIHTCLTVINGWCDDDWSTSHCQVKLNNNKLNVSCHEKCNVSNCEPDCWVLWKSDLNNESLWSSVSGP